MRDESGNVAALTALFIPVLVLLIAMLIDFGILILHHARLERTAEFAVQAGAVVVGDLIVEKAEAHNPPDDAVDPLVYLDDADRAAIEADPRVREAVDAYIDSNKDRTLPVVWEWHYSDNLMNCEGLPEDKWISLRIILRRDVTRIFSISGGIATIEESARQAVPICP